MASVTSFFENAYHTVVNSFSDLWKFNKVATAVIFGVGVIVGAIIF